jgi:hypothetical protein
MNEYKNVAQKIVFGIAVLAALMSFMFRKQFYFVVWV